MDSAVKAAIDAGITAVVISGNQGVDASRYSPGRVSEAITVGSVGSSNSKDTRSDWSNYGPG